MKILGLDAAWGPKNPDGLCFLEKDTLLKTKLTQGAETLDAIEEFQPDLIAIDAPIVVPNASGSRPIDRLITSRFNVSHKIACYPGNHQTCARILDLVRQLAPLGYFPSIAPAQPKGLIEVYPHLAIVRFFSLPERIPYKKGRVAEKRASFTVLQNQLRSYFADSPLEVPPAVTQLLKTPWTKGIEDQTDAILCALVGYQFACDPNTTELLGDLETGFIIAPR